MAVIADWVLKEIVREFPFKCHYAFAYGSAVFAQNQQGIGKMIDLVFVADDPVAWHDENLRLNRRHYSGLRFLGPKVITAVQEKMACGVYYNPYCKIYGKMVKYGVISTAALKRDLETWEHMYIAGRLHKPVLNLKPPSKSMIASLKRNRQLALSAALLMTDGIITKYQLFYKIAQLSYHGDTRMRFAENPQKMKNIVTPLMEEFDKIYMPLIKDLKSAVELPDDMIAQDLSPIARYHHLIQLPLNIQKSLVRLSNKEPRLVDIEDVLIDLTISSNLDAKIAHVLAEVVRNSSIRQTAQGLLTAGIVKSTKYALEKLSKRFQKSKPTSTKGSDIDIEDKATRTFSYVVPASEVVNPSESSSTNSKAKSSTQNEEVIAPTENILPTVQEMSFGSTVSDAVENKPDKKTKKALKESAVVKAMLERRKSTTGESSTSKSVK